MIFIWRGWGFLGLAALIPLLASCAGLFTVAPIWVIILAVSASLLFAGSVCVYWGNRWNRKENIHTLYFIPLQIWGWVYFAFLVLNLAMAAGGGAFRMARPLPGPPDPDRPAPVLMMIEGMIGLFIVAGTIWALVNSNRKQLGHLTDNQSGEAFDNQHYSQ